MGLADIMPDDENSVATARLERMADLLGRDEFRSVVEGLRRELQQALDQPSTADAHRISGLTGTLGFAVASASWRAVDQDNGSMDTALRDSRIALSAIENWLDAER